MKSCLCWLRIWGDLFRLLGLGLRSKSSLAAENLFVRQAARLLSGTQNQAPTGRQSNPDSAGPPASDSQAGAREPFVGRGANFQRIAAETRLARIAANDREVSTEIAAHTTLPRLISDANCGLNCNSPPTALHACGRFYHRHASSVPAFAIGSRRFVVQFNFLWLTVEEVSTIWR
jgi:hypothetical protein